MRRRTLRSLSVALLAIAAFVPAVLAAGPPARIDLPDGFRPEGITSDGGRRFWVGSLADGAIWQGDFRTGQGRILVAGQPGAVAVGTEYERGRGRLWVAGGNTGQVRVYDARTGALLRTYRFTSGFLNDLVVRDDAVYVTDSNNQQLIVIPLGRRGRLPSQAATFHLPLTGDLVYQEGFNLNGIASARRWLIAVQSNTGLLFRIDPRTGDTDRIDTGTYRVTNGDGIERRGHTLYVVRNRNNVVAVLRADRRFTAATLQGEITSPGLDVPSTATLALDRLWAVNARFTTPPTPSTDYWVTQLPTRP